MFAPEKKLGAAHFFWSHEMSRHKTAPETNRCPKNMSRFQPPYFTSPPSPSFSRKQNNNHKVILIIHIIYTIFRGVTRGNC